MRRAVVAGIAILACSHASAEDLGPYGFWQHPSHDSVIETFRCGDGVWASKLCARVVKTADPKAQDLKNKDYALTYRTILGLRIIDGADPAGEGKWRGMLYNYGDGIKYSIVIVAKADTLDVADRFCLLSWCKIMRWRRASEFVVDPSLGPPTEIKKAIPPAPVLLPVPVYPKLPPQPVSRPSPMPPDPLPPRRVSPPRPVATPACGPLKKNVCELTRGCAWAKGTAAKHGNCATIKQ